MRVSAAFGQRRLSDNVLTAPGHRRLSGKHTVVDIVVVVVPVAAVAFVVVVVAVFVYDDFVAAIIITR